jgi:hypothetical protein
VDTEYILRIILKARDEIAGVLARARAELKLFGTEAKNSKADIDKLNKSLSSMNTRLGNVIDKFGDWHTRVNGARSDTGQFSKSVSGLDNSIKNVNLELNKSSREHEEYSEHVRKSDKSTKGLSDTFNSTGNSIATLDNRLRGIALLLVFAFAQQLITALGGLGGAFIAVAGSAAMAGAAIAGGFTAGIAQALPMVGLLVGALSRAKQVMDAVQAAQKLQQAQFTKGGQATKQAADQADALTGAQDRLSQAQENLGRIRKQAGKDLQDLILSEKEAEAAARGAVLSEAQAQEQLRLATQRGDVEGIAQAELDVIDRKISAEQSLTRAKRATEDVKSVGGNPNNLQSVKDAARSVNEASDAVEKAKRNVDSASGSIDTAAQNLAYLLSQLSPAERELYKSVTRIRDTYKKLWRPVTDIIINSFTNSVDRIDEVIKMPKVLSSAKKMASQIGKSIDGITSHFTTDKAVSQMSRIADAGTKNIPLVTRLVEKLGDIFLKVADAAGPALRLFLQFLNDLIDRFDKTTDDGDKLTKFFISGEKHLESWINLFVSIVGLFAALTGAGGGAESGKTLIDDATKGIDEFTQKVKDNSDSVKIFFEDARHITGEVFRVLVALAKELASVFDPKGARNFADILIEVWIPALGNVIRTVGQLVDKISHLLANPIVSEVAKWTLAFLIFSQVAASTVSAMIYIVTVVKHVGTVFGLLGRVFISTSTGASLAYRSFWLLSRLMTVMTGPIGLIVGGIVLLLLKLGLLDDVGRAVLGFFGAAWKEIKPSVDDLMVSVSKLFAQMGKGKGIFAVLRPILKLIIDISAEFLKFFGRGLGRTISGAIDILSGFIDFFTAIFTGDIKGAFKALAKVFGGLVKVITAPFVTIGDAIVNGILGGLGGLGKKVVHIFNSVVNSVKDFLGIKSPSTIFKTIGKAMVDGIVDAFTALPKLILGVLGSLVSKAAKVASGAFKAAKGFITGIFGGGDDKKDDSKKSADTTIDLTSSSVADGTAGKNAKKQADIVVDAWKQMKDSAQKGSTYIEGQYRDMRVNTTRTMNRLFNDHRDIWGDVERSGKRHASDMYLGIKGSFKALQDTVYDGMKYVATTTNKALKSLGADTIKISLSAPSSTGAQKAATGGTMGSWIGNAGNRGKDKVLALLGKGELVLNHWQQKALNHMLPAQHTVQSALNQIGYHAGGPEQLGLASGGPVGMSPIPGNPGEYINPSILRELMQILHKYHARVTDGWAPQGTHATNSDHHWGGAVDLVPGNGGSWGLIDKLSQWAEPSQNHPRKPFRWVGYTGDTGHGRGNHIHLSWLRDSHFSGSLGDIIGKISSPKISGGNTPTAIIARKALSHVVNAANKKLNNVSEVASGPGDDMNGPLDAESSGPVAKTLISVWRGLHMNFKALLGAFETGIVESGMKNLPGGDADSAGWRQERASLYSNPTNVSASALRFFSEWRQFDNANLSAGDVAASVQRPAAQYRGRYSGVRSQALALLRKFGVKIPDDIPYSGGGIIGSFASGGEIPGQPGKAVGAIVHAGEWILNKFQQSRLASMMGMNSDSLRSMLGFHGAGGSKGFAGGSGDPLAKEDASLAKIGTSEEQKRRLAQIAKGFYTLPAFALDDWSDLLKEVQRAFRAISQGAKKIKDKTKRSEARTTAIDALIKEGGIFDQMETARTKLGEQLARKLILLTFKFDKTNKTVSQTGDSISKAAIALSNLQTQIAATITEKGAIKQALDSVNNSIRSIEKNGVTTKESSKFRALKTQQARLNEQMATIDEAYSSQLDSLFTAQEEARQAVIDKINSDAERQISKAERFKRIGSAIGNTDIISAANRIQREVLADQAKKLSTQIASARKSGNNVLVDQLTDQIDDINTQIFESIQQELRDTVDAINTKAQRSLTGLDAANRIFDALGVVGLDTASSALGGASRSSIFQSRGNVLATQQSELQGALTNAAASGNMKLVEELTDALTDLHVAILENTKAYFDAKFADINNRTGFANQVNDLNKQILELQGAISGNTNSYGLLALALQRTANLEAQRIELQKLLNEAVASGNQQSTNDLNVALLENQVALLQNTQAINELNGTMTEPQGFTSSAWTMFRQAIFNGNNGLLSQYSVPSSAMGGNVAVQGASTVLPSNGSSDRSSGDNVQYNDIDVNLSHPVQDVSGIEIGNKVAWSLKTATTEK